MVVNEKKHPMMQMQLELHVFLSLLPNTIIGEQVHATFLLITLEEKTVQVHTPKLFDKTDLYQSYPRNAYVHYTLKRLIQ